MFEHELNVFRFSQGIVPRLIEDVPDERLTEQPHPKMNHAAWLLGHLALTADFVGNDLNADPVAPDGWMDLFSPGTEPRPERSTYPDKAALLDALDRSAQALPKVLAMASDSWLKESSADMFKTMGLPTNRDVIAGIITSHHSFHTGQLSAWRRAMGFPPAFGQM